MDSGSGRKCPWWDSTGAAVSPHVMLGTVAETLLSHPPGPAAVIGARYG
jgi:hypothetical protein